MRLGAFRHRDFRLFWFGQLVSLIGTWMQSVGQAWLVLELTHSPSRFPEPGSNRSTKDCCTSPTKRPGEPPARPAPSS